MNAKIMEKSMDTAMKAQKSLIFYKKSPKWINIKLIKEFLLAFSQKSQFVASASFSKPKFEKIFDYSFIDKWKQILKTEIKSKKENKSEKY